MKYLFDTNILIYYFNGSLSDAIFQNISRMFQEYFAVSVISKMEFLGFSGFKHAEMEKARRFLSFAKVIPLENTIVEQVIDIKQTFKIKLPDTIIAATAMYYDLHLVTRNVQDFKHVNVNLINPFQE
jgi:hypothetical protein